MSFLAQKKVMFILIVHSSECQQEEKLATCLAPSLHFGVKLLLQDCVLQVGIQD